MRLDFLHNYPCSKQANEIFLDQEYPNAPIFVSDDADQKRLCSIFGANFTFPITFDFWSFLGLFGFFAKKKIAYCIGNHQQIVSSARQMQLHKINLQKKDGMLDFISLDLAIREQCQVFVIPVINQDIFSLNDIDLIFHYLNQKLQDFTLIVDISLSVSLSQRLEIKDEKIIFLLSGESLGLARNYGLFLSKKSFDIPFVLAQNSIYKAFVMALEKQEKIKPFNRETFFNKLKERLKGDIDLFVDIKNSALNTLALRFFGIKARLMLQDLFIQDFYGVNGQECLFGLFRPSFVLQEIGYDENQARELLSVSIKNLEDEDRLIQVLSSSYKQIKALGL
ncbi:MULTISPECIES: hypothetical protein [unclassified Helicobacter]|uniref:hypothetical protein n=1 Tax=unclassified Helicobacter TaxID=2593540 RepID=UPI000CF0CE31|nr:MULTISPECIES: hypothetical protein [unclassified Helicobacter]